jgi:HEAT repeat protein
MADTGIPERPQGAEGLEQQGFEGIVHALRENTNPKIRQYAAYLLGRAKNPLAIQPLIEALADFDKSVREQATLALSSIGKSAIKPLTEVLKEPRWETRYRAAEALGKMADETAVKPLIRALRDNRDHVRYIAAKGLRDLGNSNAIEPMIILLKDENRFVRIMAVRALGTIGGEKTDAALRQALESENDEKVKEAIREVLK